MAVEPSAATPATGMGVSAADLASAVTGGGNCSVEDLGLLA
jgi:hypothetical protein